MSSSHDRHNNSRKLDSQTKLGDRTYRSSPRPNLMTDCMNPSEILKRRLASKITETISQNNCVGQAIQT